MTSSGPIINIVLEYIVIRKFMARQFVPSYSKMDTELPNSSFPSTSDLWAMNLTRGTLWPQAHTSLAMGLIIQPVVPRS